MVGRLFLGEVVRKVKHSSVRTENPLQALYRGAEYFSLARTFRTVWGVIFFGVEDHGGVFVAGNRDGTS